MSNATYYDFHCPLGGKWYACAATGESKFVGCCTSDPCGGNGCAQGNVRSGGYNISHYGEWPDAGCGSASDFYSCNAGDTFWGCCKSNPCAATPAATCPQGDLVPAFLERPDQFSTYGSPTPTPEANSKSNTGAIAGGVVGGVAGLAIIGALIFFLLRKQKRNKQVDHTETGAAAQPMMNNEKPDERHSTQYAGMSPPPTYSAPTNSYYQHPDPSKSHYQQYANIADGPQELPAELASPNEHRFSELPASGPSDSHRFSELPAEATRATELESPQTSPRPLQTEFATDLAKQNRGLGVTTEEPPRKN